MPRNPSTEEEADRPDDGTLTPEQRLWRALRGRRLNDRKFRRKYAVDESGTSVDFVCLEAAVAIDIVGADTPKLTAEKGRALKAAKLKLLRIPEADVLGKFEKTLQLIWRETEQTVKRRPSF
jgi:very-short-patch-repair endonuclease